MVPRWLSYQWAELAVSRGLRVSTRDECWDAEQSRKIAWNTAVPVPPSANARAAQVFKSMSILFAACWAPMGGSITKNMDPVRTANLTSARTQGFCM